MLRRVYSILFYVAIPLVLLRLLWRSKREPMYRATIGERFGFTARVAGPGPIWIHSVSAGETNAVASLVSRLLTTGSKVMVTTMTPTGRQRVKTLFGDRVLHSYVPYDLPGAIRRFLDRTRPVALVIVDTELWPNMIRYTHNRGIRTLRINARLSERSARRYRLAAPLVKQALNDLDAVAVQTEADAKRLLALGLAPEKLHVTGSIKFDITLPLDIEERAAAIRRRVGDRLVFLAASTHPGEDEMVLDQFLSLNDPDLLLVLAPRHPHRADKVEQLCRARGVKVVRHSSGLPCDERTRVVLLDTMGELLYFYKLADVAFVGGSLVPVGGHNPMEPASLSVPVIMGPYLHNIEDIAARFIDQGGMRMVEDAAHLGPAIAELLGNPEARARQVKNADRVMEENRGALEQVLALILRE